MPPSTARIGPHSPPLDRGAVVLVLLALATGCQHAGYVAEQALGQAKVLLRRQKISRMLAQPELRKDWRLKLELVLRARRYGSERIGLKRTGAYATVYDTGGRPIAHNISASAKDALRPKIWRFPIVGALPYLGFFDEKRALATQRRLKAAGYDTYVRPVSAYSSLGWFDDPVYSSLLEAQPWRLIEVVLHETTHTTVFLRGRVGFNESLAVFVGQQGTLNFLAELYGPLSAPVRKAQRAFERRRRFARLIELLYQRLEALYARDVPRSVKIWEREHVFAWAKERFRELFPQNDRSSFLETKLNNAVVLSHGRYLQGLRFHAAVYRCLGRRLDRLVGLYRQTQHLDDPLAPAARHCGLSDQPPQSM